MSTENSPYSIHLDPLLYRGEVGKPKKKREKKTICTGRGVVGDHGEELPPWHPTPPQSKDRKNYKREIGQ